MTQTTIKDPGISAIASYLPEAILDNKTLEAEFDFKSDFLAGKLGIERRHIAGEDEAVSDMATKAASALFDAVPFKKEEIGILVLCTQNPDYRLPTTACLVQDRLGLRNDLAAFDINQGCSGYVYGLSTIRSMMLAEDIPHGLLITAEAYSKFIDADARDVRPLFGDGATATLISAGGLGQIGRCTFGSDGSGAEELIVRGGGSRNPDMAIAGDGSLQMNGRAIFNFMMKRVPADVRACLERNGNDIDDIDLFIFHQASRYMVESLVKSMKLPPEKVVIDLAETGNTVSSTLPLAIENLGDLQALCGKRVLLSGFGVGLSWASTIITFAG